MSTPVAPVSFSSLGLPPELTDVLAALGYEEPTPVQRETIPLLIAGQGSARPGRHGHRQDGRVRAADVAAHQRGKTPHASDRGIDSRADARAGDAGGRGGAQVLQGRAAVGAAGVRRRADARTDSRARARRADRRGDAGSSARSHPAGNAQARHASRARPRRSGRNARHGVRRRSRRDSRSDAGDATDGALLGDDAGAHSVDRGATPEGSRAHHDRARESGGRQDAARPPGGVYRRACPEGGDARADPRHGRSGRHAGLLPHTARSGVARRDVQRARPSRRGAARRHGAEATRPRDGPVPRRRKRTC